MDEKDAGSNGEQQPTQKVSGQGDRKTGEETTIVDIINVIADRVNPLIELVKTFFEQSIKSNQVAARLQIKMAWAVIVVVVLIVAVAGALTYLDKIDGATFTFLLGLVLGYVLTFIRDTVQPPAE